MQRLLPVASGATFAALVLCGLAAPAVSQAEADAPGALGRPELVIDPRGFTTNVTGLSFSPDGRFLAAAGGQEVRVWDLVAGRLHRTLRGEKSRGSSGNCLCVAFSPDGRELVVGIDDYSETGSLRVYNVENLDEIQFVAAGQRVPVRRLAFSRNGRYLASAGENGVIVLWDWPARKPVGQINPPRADQPLYWHLDFPTAAPVLVVGSEAGQDLYSVPSGVRFGPTDRPPPEIVSWVSALSTQYPIRDSVDLAHTRLDRGCWLAAGTAKSDKATQFWVSIWCPTSGKATPVAVYRGHQWQVTALAVNEAASLAASADEFGEVHVWDWNGAGEAGTGRVRAVFRGLGRPIYSVGVEAVGNGDATDLSRMRIVFGTKSYGGADWGFNHYGDVDRFFDLRTRALGTIAPKTLPAALTTREGQQLQIVMDNDSYVLQLMKDKDAVGSQILAADRIPMCYGFLKTPYLGTATPVLLGVDNGSLACVDLETGRPVRTFVGHDASVTSFQEVPNAPLLVTASSDRTIKFWRLDDYHASVDFGLRLHFDTVVDVARNADVATRKDFIAGDRILTVDGKSLAEWEALRLAGNLGRKPGQKVTVVLEREGETVEQPLTLVAGGDAVEPLLNLFVADDGKWVLWTPQGYYDASPGGDRLIGWHINQGRKKAAQFLLADQFPQMYRPDIIDRVLKTGNPEAAIAAANAARPQAPESVDLRRPETLKKVAPPSVRFLGPADALQTKDANVRISALINSPDDLPLKEVRLLLNGRPAVGAVELPEQGTTRFELKQEIQLFPGQNEVSIIAANASAQSQTRSITLYYDAPRTEDPATLYLVAIGISKYQQEKLRLQYAADDARAFAEAMGSHENGRIYGKVHTQLLTDEKATRENILAALDWLKDSATNPNDRAMVFISGHGFNDDDQHFYLSTQEVDPEKLAETAVSVTHVEDCLKDLRCPVVMFVDTCHAGGLGAARINDPFRNFSDDRAGVLMFCSSTHREESLESDVWKHGAFTRALLDMIGSKESDQDRPPDASLSISEVMMQLNRRVQQLTDKAQHAVMGRPSSMPEINLFEIQSQTVAKK